MINNTPNTINGNKIMLIYSPKNENCIHFLKYLQRFPNMGKGLKAVNIQSMNIHPKPNENDLPIIQDENHTWNCDLSFIWLINESILKNYDQKLISQIHKEIIIYLGSKYSPKQKSMNPIYTLNENESSPIRNQNLENPNPNQNPNQNPNSIRPKIVKNPTPLLIGPPKSDKYPAPEINPILTTTPWKMKKSNFNIESVDENQAVSEKELDLIQKGLRNDKLKTETFAKETGGGGEGFSLAKTSALRTPLRLKPTTAAQMLKESETILEFQNNEIKRQFDIKGTKPEIGGTKFNITPKRILANSNKNELNYGNEFGPQSEFIAENTNYNDLKIYEELKQRDISRLRPLNAQVLNSFSKK